MTLVEKYGRLVCKQAWKANRSGLLSQDDLQAAGMRGLVEAEQTWVPERGSLCTWAFICARKAIQVEATKQRRSMGQIIAGYNRNGIQNPTVDKECNLVDTLGADAQTEDEVNRAELHDLLLAQIQRLPTKQRKLMIKMLAQGMTRAEYAAEEACSPQAVQQLYLSAIARLRGLLRQQGVSSLAEVLD